MDPNANLAEQLRLSESIIANYDEYEIANAGCRLAELVVALNNWILNKGFLPDAWKEDTCC
jgi:hypothetical protein